MWIVGAAIACAAWALLYVWAGRRDRKAAHELQALQRELETATPARAREIRALLRKRARDEAVVQREFETWGDGLD